MAEVNKSFREKFLSGFFWLSTGAFLRQTISWIATIFVIRLLLPSDYGLMAMAMSFIGIISSFSELGMGSSIVQAENIKEFEIRKLFGFSITISFIGWLMCLIIAPPIASFYNAPKLVLIIRILSLNLLFSSLYIVPKALLVREINFKTISIIEGISVFGSSMLTLLLAIHGVGVWSLVIGLNGLHVLKIILFNAVCSTWFKPAFNFKGSGKFISYGMHITGSRLLYSIYHQSDAIIIGKILGDNLLGIYNVALSLASIPVNKALPIINEISFTSFSRMQDDMERIRKNLLRACRYIAIPSFPIFFGMASVAPEGVPLLLGPKWNSVVIPFQLLCFVIPLKSLSPIIHTTINAVGKPVINLTNNLITTVIMILGFFIGVRYGLHGVCIAWIIAYPISFIITSRRALHFLGMTLKNYLYEAFFPMITSSIMFFCIVILKMGLYDFSPLSTLIICVMFGVIFCAMSIVIFQKDEYFKIKIFISETINLYVRKNI